MKIGILGDGAMGCLYGALLSISNDVTVIGRNREKSERLQKSGITVRRDGIDKRYNPRAEDCSVSGLSNYDLLVLFVKSFAVESVLAANKDKIGCNTYVLVLQNGAGHDKYIKKYVDESHILIGTTQHGASLVGEGIVNHSGIGETVIGFAKKELADDKSMAFLQHIADTFSECSLSCRITDDVMKTVWHKLFTNASASITTALLLCPMEYLAQNENAWSMVKALIKECVKVAFAAGYDFDLDQIESEVRGVCERAKNGYTSIYTDIKNGRRTEVDAISGFVVSEGKRLQVQTPRMEFAVNMIHGLEAKNAFI